MNDDLTLDLASETVCRFLAAAISDPRSDAVRLLFDRASQTLAAQAAELLRDEAIEQPTPLGFGELPADDLNLSSLPAELPATISELRNEYARVFGLVSCRECPPYETEFQPIAEPFFRAQQMADVAGFYRAFGLDTTHVARERPDHLALELEFAAFLLAKKREALSHSDPDRAAICDSAREAFFRDHISWWVPSFAVALRRKADHGFYATVARVLSAWLPVERQRLGLPPPQMPLQLLPVVQQDEDAQSCAGCVANSA